MLWTRFDITGCSRKGPSSGSSHQHSVQEAGRKQRQLKPPELNEPLTRTCGQSGMAGPLIEPNALDEYGLSQLRRIFQPTRYGRTPIDTATFREGFALRLPL